MTDGADYSVWSTDEMELLDNIKKEIKLGRSGSDSDSSKLNKSMKEPWKVLQKNEMERSSDDENLRKSRKNFQFEEFSIPQGNVSLCKSKMHYSSNDLSNLTSENMSQNESGSSKMAQFNHSNSYNCLSNNEKPVTKKYDHVQSKIKQYFNDKSTAKEAPPKEQKVMNNVTKAKGFDNRDYLEEINMRLMRELDEKNALITKLQENYENLLFKYAEAQNKIDQLRFRSVCEPTECPIHSVKQKSNKGNQSPTKVFYSDKEDQDSWDERKGKKEISPLAKNDFHDGAAAKKADRPLSLPVEAKGVERDEIKVGTPTDSEGVSSVITSMSGHSKILNSLEVHSSKSRDYNFVKYSERNFLLGDDSIFHEAFHKVKSWQNSLPPLEYIETPETALYDKPPVQISPPANYTENAEEACALDLNLNPEPLKKEGKKDAPQIELNDVDIQDIPLPPPAVCRKKNLSPLKQQNDSGNVKNIYHDPSCITQRRKKPELPRCSSLPTCDTPKSSRRSIYIPPLHLENLTLSDVESSEIYYYDYDKTNLVTSSSYLTSQSGSMEFPSQTFRSNYKERNVQYSESPFSERSAVNKSTSITPDRCSDAFPLSRKPHRLCRVCGEQLEEGSFPCRSTSYETFLDVKEAGEKAAEKLTKYPLSRSVSFNSDMSSFRRCFHSQDCFMRRKNEDSLEKFDAYTNNLKARSQVVMKALAAHVNNT